MDQFMSDNFVHFFHVVGVVVAVVVVVVAHGIHRGVGSGQSGAPWIPNGSNIGRRSCGWGG